MLLLAVPGTALFLFGLLAVPLIWSLEGVLPDMRLRFLLWGCASVGEAAPAGPRWAVTARRNC